MQSMQYGCTLGFASNWKLIAVFFYVKNKAEAPAVRLIVGDECGLIRVLQGEKSL